jgi:hypothetical protein
LGVNSRFSFIVVGAAACKLSPIYVSGGATWLSNRGSASGYGISLGAGYVLQGHHSLSHGGDQGSAQFDFEHFGGSTHIETYDLEYVERFSATKQFYYGVGAGLRVAHFGVASSSAPDNGGSDAIIRPDDLSVFGGGSATQTTGVAEALVGYQLTKAFALEAAFKVAPSYHSQSTDGVTVLLKYSF